MLMRRNFVTGAIAAGPLMRSQRSDAKASQPSTAVNFDVPPHACDGHTHYYGDPHKFQLFPQRVNTPEGTLPEEMASLHRTLRRGPHPFRVLQTVAVLLSPWSRSI